MNKWATDRAGYTLIEVLAVALLISILSVIANTQYISFNNDAKIAVTKEKLAALRVAITGDGRFTAGGVPTKLGYEANCQGLPGSIDDLVVRPAAGVCASDYDPYTRLGWRGPYVSAADPSWKLDGWGHAIEYFSVGPPARSMKSCGIDGVCGNADDISVTF